MSNMILNRRETAPTGSPGIPLPSISFSGCAWLISYHLGVIDVAREVCDLSRTTFLGASSGSLAAILAAAEIKTADALDFIITMVRDVEPRWLGPFGRMSQTVTAGLRRLMPEDTYLRVRGRVYISVTRLPTLRNLLLPERELRSNEELLRIALASCYIPLYYERPVFYGGFPALDGGASNNLPQLDAHTVLVSPTPSFQRKRLDIFPKEEPPLITALLPRVTIVERLFEQGREDGLAFFTTTLAARARPEVTPIPPGR
ncbi:transport-secretion protein 2.2 [Cystobacter fuscus]|uniref:Transport-secretion protein 2.2 n=1 Tax=Cystobacter fuscus TaxID=43 RepID=A0A250JIK8_9BACT|nr:patatin-like phospholipase family protein [Cystobacter fuscus]ATB43438.1 transport-secretion protein 2.2 [Cystobacter fuscus]